MLRDKRLREEILNEEIWDKKGKIDKIENVEKGVSMGMRMISLQNNRKKRKAKFANDRIKNK